MTPKSLFSCFTTVLISAAPLTAQITVDGTRAGENYGTAVSIQTQETLFGDNQSELNAAYVQFEGGRLYLMLTGNLENNFNKLEIFFDTRPGGETVFSGIPGNDSSNLMTGLTFDTGFEPDFHVIGRRDFTHFELDISELGTPNFSHYPVIFSGVTNGSGTSGTGPANQFPIEAGYDDSNIAGIGEGFLPADPVAAQAVETGFEMSIDLRDIGNPTDDIKILAFVNGANHDFASNQFLGGISILQIGNLGGDGAGNFTGTCVFDLNMFGEDQFFTVSQTIGTNYCSTNPNSTGSPANISATGSTSVTANDLVLRADPVPIGQPGVFYYGPNALAGLPFGDGLRCVGGQAGTVIRVYPFAVGDASERMSIQLNNTLPVHSQVMPSATLNFQAWFRDPAAGLSGFNLSDGLELTFEP